MYILELTYPGTWLEYEDQEGQRTLESLLRTIESQLTEATMALNLFEIEQQRPNRKFDPDTWDADALRRRQIEKKIRKEEGIDQFDYSRYDEIHHRVEVELKREKWQRGELPDQYQHCLPFLYAKLFLFAVDSIRKCLIVLDRQDGVPEEVHATKKSFDVAFPDLRGVRDSTAHSEDRNRGLGRWEKPLDLKPVSNRLVHAPGGGALILGSLNGNRFGSTMDDGHYGEVEVSIKSLAFVRDCFQRIIDSFTWKGSKTHYPR